MEKRKWWRKMSKVDWWRTNLNFRFVTTWWTIIVSIYGEWLCNFWYTLFSIVNIIECIREYEHKNRAPMILSVRFSIIWGYLFGISFFFNLIFSLLITYLRHFLRKKAIFEFWNYTVELILRKYCIPLVLEH